MTKQLFLDSGLVPDPHEALYSPGVLGDGTNYLEFWNLTPNISWVKFNWFLTSSNPESNSSTHYAGVQMSRDRSLSGSGENYANRWFYSQIFEWMYIDFQTIKTKEADQSVDRLSAFIFKDFGQSGDDKELVGWIIMLRGWSDIHTIYTGPNGTPVPVDFLIYRINDNITYGVKVNESEIEFIDGEGNTYILYNTTVEPSEDFENPPSDPIQVPDFAQPPQPTIDYPDGFKESNVICCGYDNEIYKSRNCTIINGKNVYIGKIPQETADIGQCNCTVIGGVFNSKTQFRQSNAFYVHCDNGLHCDADVVSSRLSDESLKENKTKIKNATSKIKKIKAVSFDWNEDQQTYKGHDIGLIAQDVEEVIPEAVSNRKNGFKGVQYHKVIPLLIASIKEKQSRINTLKNKINTLKDGKL